MKSLNIEHTEVFTRNWNCLNDDKVRFIFNQGGSRSSKTYSICQMLIVYCLSNPKKGVSIIRKSFPTLRASIMRDFFSIMKELELYDERSHSRTEHIYTFDNGSWVEFFSIDDEQKVRGRKRDILFCNEANEIEFDEFNQLVMRTTGKVIMDYNPSDTEHWIYDIINQDNSVLVKSTYKDNPFLTKEQVEYIENLINVDENYYKIYALGERPTSQSRIYTHFKQYVDDASYEDYCYGLDFGFNHPSALILTNFKDNKIFVKELIYKSGLTTTDLIKTMLELNIDKSKPIYCDSARPEVIEEIRRAGFYKATLSNKNVKEGIDKIKSMEVFIHIESVNLWREYRMYSWRTYKNMILDEPIKENDDAMDALRYSVYSHNRKVKGVPFYIG
jgi:phage terminase large subunit